MPSENNSPVSERFTMQITMFQVSGEVCMRAATLSGHAILYRIPHVCAHVLDSEQGKAKEQNKKIRGELKMDGIYILVDTVARTVYTGKASCRSNGKGVLRRMLDDHKLKDGTVVKWNVGFILTSRTKDFLTSDDLKYLESFFCEMAGKTGRYDVWNKKSPSKPKEDVIDDTEEKLGPYIKEALFMLSFDVGCEVFEKKQIEEKKESFPDSEHVGAGVQKKACRKTSICKRNHKKQFDVANQATVHPMRKALMIKGPRVDAYAYGEMIDEKRIVVKAGSKVSKTNKLLNQSGCSGIYAVRVKLEESGIIRNRVFTEDYVFPTASNAAKIILGTSASGNQRWKKKDGTKLEDLHVSSRKKTGRKRKNNP